MADLLENWHLPLTDFMQRVQTYYGQATRLKLDRDSVITRQTLRVAEWHLYGSSRLGIYKTQDTLRTVDLSLVYKLSDVKQAPTQTLTQKEFYSFDSTYTHKRGDKLYEGSNHLGNVLVTFSDKRLAECLEGSVHYQADVRSATDYAAFGALLDDRQWYSSTDSAFYRYGGSNSQEKDDEIYGTGNSYSAEFWQYDPRLARRWNVDPLFREISNQTPYSVNHGNPILFKDVEGDFGLPGVIVGGLIGRVSFLTQSVLQNGWSSLKDGKTWGKARVNAIGGGLIGLTGGIGSGLIVTAITTFGTSLAEDKIDGKELDFNKATISSLISTATFGLASYGVDKLSKQAIKHWWNGGNTNLFMRWVGKAPRNNIGLLVERLTDIADVASSIAVDKLFPNHRDKKTIELPEVLIKGKLTDEKIIIIDLEYKKFKLV